MKPEIDTATAEAACEKQTAPRVTVESITEKITSVEYVVQGVLTIATITMRNGFKVVGSSAPVSPANYYSDVGELFAYEDAFNKLWPLEGYLLRERLMTEGVDWRKILAAYIDHADDGGRETLRGVEGLSPIEKASLYEVAADNCDFVEDYKMELLVRAAKLRAGQTEAGA